MASVELNGRQRRSLRALAHTLKPVVHIGNAGTSEAVIRAVDAALLTHELIKVRLHRPEDKKGASARIATATGSALCGLVGHTLILYRPHPEKPRIQV
jgi:RNA-binding protein